MAPNCLQRLRVRLSAPPQNSVGCWLLGFAQAMVTLGLLILLAIAVEICIAPDAATIPSSGEARITEEGEPPVWRPASLVSRAIPRLFPASLDSGVERLTVLLALAILLGLVRAGLRYFIERKADRIAEGLAAACRAKLLAKAHELGPVDDLLEAALVGPAQLALSHVEHVRRSSHAYAQTFVVNVTLLIVLVAMAIVLQPWLSLAGVLLALASGFLLNRVDLRMREHKDRAIDRATRALALLKERIHRAGRTNALVADESSDSLDAELIERTKAAQIARRDSTTLRGPVGQMALAGGVALLCYLAALNVVQSPRRLYPADAVLLLGCLGVCVEPFRKLVRLRVQLAETENDARLICEYFDREPKTKLAPSPTRLPRLQGQIEFTDVSVSDPLGHKFLERVDLTLLAGSRTALVAADERAGRAIIALMRRAIDPAAGVITWDGIDLRQASLTSLRRQVMVVTTDDLTEGVTIADNITGGDTRVSMRHVAKACKRAQIYSLIEQWPQGLQTVLGEQNRRLLPHEMLRLSLARAPLFDPAFVIVDEVQDVRDPRVTETLEKALHRAIRDRTVLFLNPRLNTLRTVDRVIVFHQGAVLAAGKHADLLQSCDLYRHLQYLRFNEFRAVEEPLEA